jgi:gluconolactonase
MKHFTLIVLVIAVLIANPIYAQQEGLLKIEVIRLDPRFDKVVPANVRIEKVAGDHKWVEGPVWNPKEGFLLFSDIPANAIYKWQQGKGESLFLKPSGYTGKAPFEGPEPGSNGLTYDSDGRLVLAEHGDRRIARLDKNGRKTTLVDRFDGKRINSPNDLVFKSNGDLYFTDPPFGLPKNPSTMPTRSCRSRAFIDTQRMAS